MNKKILVIGGGIAGMYASMELAELGFFVYLIEKNFYLGGNSLNLYKYFPTYDCSFCISSVQNLKGMRKCFYRSNLDKLPNLKIFTNTYLIKVNGEKGDFKVKLIKRPLYINLEKCTLCKACLEVCKSNAINLEEKTLSPCLYIDMEKCTLCKACLEVCKSNAINLEEKEEEIELEVGAIIVATGFEEWKPYEIKHYGYGRYENVITQSELAEILYNHDRSKTKPDLNKIKKVVIILCVGSRDNYHEYCSKICCSYAIKHAIEIKNLGKDVVVCYIDIRTMGEYEELYKKAREKGVNFIRGKPGEILKNKSKLIVNVEDTLTKEVKSIECDLVVLTPALIPSHGTKKIGEILNLERDEYGFIKTKKGKTSRRGIYACGCASGIKDIPSTITQASQVAINIMEELK